MYKKQLLAVAARVSWRRRSMSRRPLTRLTTGVDVAPSLKIAWSNATPNREGFYCARTVDGDICFEDVWLDETGAPRIGCLYRTGRQMRIEDYQAWAGPIIFSE